MMKKLAVTCQNCQSVHEVASDHITREGDVLYWLGQKVLAIHGDDGEVYFGISACEKCPKSE